MNKFLIALVLFASCASPQPPQSPKTEGAKTAAAASELSSKTINAPQLLEDVRVLSGDAMEGRGMGTQGGVMARTLIIRRFADVGLKTFGDSYEKPFEAGAGGASKIRAANVV